MSSQKLVMTLTLMDGTADGAIKCSIKFQDSVFYKVSRDKISDYVNEPDLKKGGIYFLLGEINGEKAVYIGQANIRKNGNGVLGRILEHRTPKDDYWTDAFILISSSNSIMATELNYLENHFCNMAINANNYKVVNAADPNKGNYSDEIEIAIETIIDNTIKALNVFGYRVFDNKTVSTTIDNTVSSNDNGVIFEMKRSGENGRFVDAKCLYKNNTFTLLKGSIVAMVPTKSCPDDLKKQRQLHSKDIDKNGKVLRDIVFSSPSGVSRFAMFAASNGKIEMKDSSGKTYKDLFEA